MQYGLANSMDLNEFKEVVVYKNDLITVGKIDGSLKNAEFFSLVPLVLQKYKDIKVRDFLDVDGTFAVIVPTYVKFTLSDALDLYQSIRDVISVTTYSKIIKEGLIKDLEFKDGFWVQFG